MDPFSHPELAQIGRSLRSKLDETLDAEQAAARTAALRRMSLRDRLIVAADRSETLLVSTVDGHLIRGVVESAGIDHVVVRDASSNRWIAINHIVMLESL